MSRKEKLYSYVYKTVNIKNNEYYVGLSSCDCNPQDHRYLGSGKRIVRSIKKHGRQNFNKNILKIFYSRKEASIHEAFIVNEDMLADPLCLNLKTGGEYETGVRFHKDTRKKISQKLKKYYKKPDSKKKLSENIKRAYKDNPEYGLRISRMRKRVLQDPEHIKKSSDSRKKLFESAEYREKIKKAINSKEAKEKKSISLKKYCSTEKGKQNLSLASKNTVYINNSKETKRIHKDKIQKFLDDGWGIGSLLPVTEETRKKLGEATKNRIWMYNIELCKNKRVKIEEYDEFLLLGWIKGIKKWK